MYPCTLRFRDSLDRNDIFYIVPDWIAPPFISILATGARPIVGSGHMHGIAKTRTTAIARSLSLT